ncbi:hypothetical protein AB0I82_33955 [Streptomyces sp. NPDC050315]|uniref:MinD/ParA family ATP-binding protein n=1 Tax=Streptomyces sp. NPDC050315 TaxID=3155039 RepID=UPI00341C7585
MSTLALALAAAWPADGARPVVVEADAAGGDLAVRFGLSDMAGLLTLAAGARQDGAEAGLDGCTQEVPGGLRVVVAPTGMDQAAPCVAEIAAHPAVLRGESDSEGTVLLDLGHLGAAASRELAQAADQLVLVTRGSKDALAHVAARPEWLAAAEPELVVVGECRYAEADVAKALEMEAGQSHLVPWDARAGAALGGAGRLSERRWRRSPLARAAARLARHLAGVETGSRGGGLAEELAQVATGALHGPALDPAGEGGAR